MLREVVDRRPEELAFRRERGTDRPVEGEDCVDEDRGDQQPERQLRDKAPERRSPKPAAAADRPFDRPRSLGDRAHWPASGSWAGGGDWGEPGVPPASMEKGARGGNRV